MREEVRFGEQTCAFQLSGGKGDSADCSVDQRDLCPLHQVHTHDSPRHNFEKVIMGLTRRNILSELLKDLWALSNNHLSAFKSVPIHFPSAPWRLGFACHLASRPRHLVCCFSEKWGSPAKKKKIINALHFGSNLRSFKICRDLEFVIYYNISKKKSEKGCL